MAAIVVSCTVVSPNTGLCEDVPVHPHGFDQDVLHPGACRYQSHAPPSVRRNIVFAPFYFPAESLGGIYSYTGTVMAGNRSIAKYEAKGAKVILAVPRGASQKAGPLISVAGATTEIKSWDSTSIAHGIADGTVAGFMVSDDITGKNIWGPNAPYFPQIDSIGCSIKKRWPNATTYVRARPGELRYAWKCLDGSWSQYGSQYGDVNKYIGAQLADAKAQHLCNLFGLNPLNRGDGSSGLVGTQTGYWQMTGAEIFKYVAPMLRRTPVVPLWSWGPSQGGSLTGFDRRPDVLAAYVALQVADTLSSLVDAHGCPL